MIIFSYLCFIALLIHLSLGLFVVHSNPKESVNRSFFFFSVVLAFMSLGFTIIYAPSSNLNQINFWIKLASIGWTIGPPAVTIFCLNLTNSIKPSKKWVVHPILFLPGILMALHIFTSLPPFNDPGMNVFDFIKDSNQNFFIIYLIYQVLTMLAIPLGVLIFWARHSKKKEEKVQASLIISALLLMYIVSYIWDLIDFGFINGQPTITPITILIWSFAIMFAIIKYHFMSLSPSLVTETIINNMQDLMILVDENKNVIYVNRHTKTITGFDDESLLNKTVDDIFESDEDDISYLISILDSKYFSKGVWELKLKTLNGRNIPVRLSGSVAEVKNIKIGTVFIGHDLRLQRKLEKANIKLVEAYRDIEKTNDELHNFAYMASHDLKEPLRNISSFTTLLKKDLEADLKNKPEHEEYMKFIQDGVARLNMIIDGLLKYSRIETTGKSFQPIILDQLIDDIIKYIQLSITESNSKIKKSGVFPIIMGDTVQITQVFQNLILNSIKYKQKDKDPIIEISAETNGQLATIHIKDNGIGIQQKDQKELFKMFKRLHTQKEIPGSGIGLAICKRIITRHGGNLTVESEPGEGSIFSFTLNIAQNYIPGL